MGWTHTKKSSEQSMLDFFISSGVLRWTLPEGSPLSYRVLDSGTVKRRVFYAAVERVDRTDPDNPQREVFAFIILLRWVNSAQGYNILFKELDETCGPYEAECPERILDLLTETTCENSLDWRKRCREYHAKRKSTKLLKAGDVVAYGGNTYRLRENLGRKGWEVEHTGSGYIYRMRQSQLVSASVRS